MSRRPALRAVTATAGIALVAVGGFGLLAQPRASAATATSSGLCIPIPLIITCPPPTPTPPPPSTSTPGGGTTTPASPIDTPSQQPTVGNAPTLYTEAAQPQAAQTVVSGPVPGPNLAVSHVVVRKVRGKLDVTGIVTNTGTVLLQNVPLSVSASGVGTQRYVVTLNPGQHLGFHTRWTFRAAPRTKTIVVNLDPQHLVAETSKADNRVSVTKTFR